MNNKKAKRYRSLARAMTTGFPERRYRRDDNGTIQMIPACTRRVYQMIKRGQPLKALTEAHA